MTTGITYVLALSELDATRIRRGTRCLHHESTVTALREEVVVTRVLIPAAADQLGWVNEHGRTVAYGELELPFAEVEVATRSTARVESPGHTQGGEEGETAAELHTGD